MQYLLTQDELDGLKNKPRVTAQEFLNKLGEFTIYRTVCVDVLIGPISVITYENFKTAVQKTVDYYAK